MTGAVDPAPDADTWRVDVDGDPVTAVYEPPRTGPLRTLFVCAHGAGGHMGDKAMLAATAALRGIGLGVARFNFVYREKGSKRPDAMPRLQLCFESVLASARTRLAPAAVLIGGRSMGGRTASMLAAAGHPCDGLLLLAYPLHPAGEPAKLRDAHLARIKVPVLCFNGTRDTLCEQPLMQKTVETLARLSVDWTMHWLEAADHSFHVLKSSGRTDAQVLDEVAAATRAWLAAKAGARP